MSADTPSLVSPLPFDGERAVKLIAEHARYAQARAQSNRESAEGFAMCSGEFYRDLSARYAERAVDEQADADALRALADLLPALLEARKDGERWRFAQKYGVDMDYSDCVYVYRGPAGGDTYESIDEAMAATHTPEPSDAQP